MKKWMFGGFCLLSTVVWLPLSALMVSRYGFFESSSLASLFVVLFMLIPPCGMLLLGWYYETEQEDLELSELRRELSFANSQLNRLNNSLRASTRSVQLAKSLIHSLHSLSEGKGGRRSFARVADHVFSLLERNLGVKKAAIWVCDENTGVGALTCFHGMTADEAAEKGFIDPGDEIWDEELSFPLISGGKISGLFVILEADNTTLLVSGEEQELIFVLCWILSLHCAGSTYRGGSVEVTDAPESGVYSYSHMMKILGRESSRAIRYGEIYTILLVEIGHYESLRDLHGEEALMVFKNSLSCLLSSLIREMDVVGTYGDGSFIVMLPQTHKNGGTNLARRVEQTAESQLRLKDGSINVEVVVSVASFPADGQNEMDLIKNVSDDWRAGEQNA